MQRLVPDTRVIHFFSIQYIRGLIPKEWFMNLAIGWDWMMNTQEVNALHLVVVTM